ncbi:MAG TPA: hypothetical protein VL947_14280 [Cytophagales bacterium]|nr:hypothetical protein [Cytophagales bacterium]
MTVLTKIEALETSQRMSDLIKQMQDLELKINFSKIYRLAPEHEAEQQLAVKRAEYDTLKNKLWSYNEQEDSEDEG